MKRVRRFSIMPGGGCKGIIQARVLRNLENEVGPLYEFFDASIGTSVGSILSGFFSYGIFGKTIDTEIVEGLRHIFKERTYIPGLMNAYERSRFDDVFSEFVSGSPDLSKMKNLYISTSFNRVTRRTHFFKSDDIKDSSLGLSKVMKRSFAAPHYFGQYVDEDGVWMDGGSGMNNSPISFAYTEALLRGWLNEPIEFWIIGPFKHFEELKYNDIKNDRPYEQILDYASPTDGGLARVESHIEQLRFLQQVAKYNKNIRIVSIDSNIRGKYDAMDKVEYYKEYQNIGDEVTTKELIKKYVDDAC